MWTIFDVIRMFKPIQTVLFWIIYVVNIERSEFLFRKTSQYLSNVLLKLSSSVKWVLLPLTFLTKVQSHFNETAIEQSILTL